MSQSATLVSQQPSNPDSKPTPDAGPKPWLGPAPKAEQKGIYIFLWDTGAKGKYHWGLFIALSQSSGVLFHHVPIGNQWEFLMENEDILTSQGLLAGLKIGEIEEINGDWLKAVEDCVRSARVDKSRGEFNSRTWVMAAIYELANGGFIWLDPDWGKVRHIEEEALRLALDAVAVDMQIISQSELSGP
ncbi:predicted protein [Uncinocarpus reesii 1704]|uniref:Uncharacterized protein n=1 Tax=Uncinocarpus reesii (strain UAMH 1704) TaxID=336963 RepID=C4JS18_UNCRE|nr:uncharacterized protein UREG_05257 [Uncinocarpus reesii 1704]EEP80415.1 predicted protein [Uncinocarpus reesii 1704]